MKRSKPHRQIFSLPKAMILHQVEAVEKLQLHLVQAVVAVAEHYARRLTLHSSDIVL
jgi:hypothetical protein